VRRTFAALRTKFNFFKALGHRLFVPSRRVVAALTFTAGKNREIAHNSRPFIRRLL
jgi:hypothetical protein